MHKPLPSFVHMIFVLGWRLAHQGGWCGDDIYRNIIYAYPITSLNEWGITALQNQFWGGILIWGFGGLAFSTSAAFYFASLVRAGNH